MCLIIVAACVNHRNKAWLLGRRTMAPTGPAQGHAPKQSPRTLLNNKYGEGDGACCSLGAVLNARNHYACLYAVHSSLVLVQKQGNSVVSFSLSAYNKL